MHTDSISEIFSSTTGPHIVAISSGKGGVGKTLTTVHFAMIARRLGLKTLIIDGDLGMSNIDIILGIQTEYTLNDVLENVVDLKTAITTGPYGIHLLSSGSGLYDLQNISILKRQLLSHKMQDLEADYDLILIDTGAGIGQNVTMLNSSAHSNIIVTTPEPHAITDAYAVIKVLREEESIHDFTLIVNMTHSDNEGQIISERIRQVCQKFLPETTINYIGSVPADKHLSQNVIKRCFANTHSTQTISGQSWAQISNRFISNLIQDNRQTNSYERNSLGNIFA